MKKTHLVIIILLVIIVFSLLFIGARRRHQLQDRRQSLWSIWSRRPTPSPSPSHPKLTEGPTATPRPTSLAVPTTPPTSPPSKPTYQISISESEFNSYLAQGVAQQSPKENPCTSATLKLQTDVGLLNMHFEKGQDLVSEVFVTPDGKNLDLRHVSVVGAAGFESSFIQIASDLIKDGLSNFVSRLGASIRIEKLEIQTDSLLIHYQLL